MNSKIVSYGTSVPSARHSQIEIMNALSGLDQAYAQRLARKTGIEYRFLSADLSLLVKGCETQGNLIRRHQEHSVELGAAALEAAARRLCLKLDEIDHLCCVTSTGFLLPGLSVLIGKRCGIHPACERIDIVGMGCGAGVRGLIEVADWTVANPSRYGALVCCEVNSAIYSSDESRETMVVNSLFADGGAALILEAQPQGASGWIVLDSESLTLFRNSDDLRFDWDEDQSRWRFRLGRQVPSLIGDNIRKPLAILLDRIGVKQNRIKYWLIHGGGPELVRVIKRTLGLTDDDLRYTELTIKGYGNLSSASCLFSLALLWDEMSMASGDCAAIIAMGPGISIEASILEWHGNKVRR
ncbi:MAG: 3-oxoacyl-[acyl-carrier-protein] synthase III C-terminal domain-containing protein [Thermoanaerobaculia bacterium]